MSRTLSLLQAGWDAVRSSLEQGRATKALAQITRLLALPELPVAIATEAHQLAGELQSHAGRFPQARRHLKAAVALNPRCARKLYLWGLAHEQDPHGSDRKAANRFRKASELEPTNPLYRAAWGRAIVRCGRVKSGVRELLAASAETSDLHVLRVAVDGLCEAGRFSAARRVLAQARFRCFGSARERDFRDLESRVQFTAASCSQRGTARHRQDAEFARDGGRAVLPFIRVAGGGSIRTDAASFSQPHFPRLRVRRSAP